MDTAQFCMCACTKAAHHDGTGSCRNCPSCKAFALDGVYEGRRLRDTGAALAHSAESSDWTIRADEAIAELARRGVQFTAEDVRAIAGDPGHMNAMGGAFLRALRAGVITHAGYVQAKRTARHASVLRSWVGVA